MLYSSYRGAGGTFRGKTWKLPNGYWRSCNYNGQQCTFKIWNEALRFADKGKPLSENKEITLQAVRTRHEAAAMAKHAEKMTNVISTSVKELSNGHFQPVLMMKEGYQRGGARNRSHYMPELSRREMNYLASNLVKQGYNVKVKGPNLVTDAPEEQIQASFGPGPSEVNEARSRTHYLPGLNSRMMHDLGGELVRKGYKIKIKGPNLSTDAPEKLITRIVDDFSTGGGQHDWRVSSKREAVVDEARTSLESLVFNAIEDDAQYGNAVSLKQLASTARKAGHSVSQLKQVVDKLAKSGVIQHVGGGDYEMREDNEVVDEAKSSFTLHAMGNGWSHSKTISASSQKEAEAMFRQDPRFRKEARRAGEKWKEVPIVGDREAKSKFGKVKKTQEPDMDRSAFLSRTKGPPSAAPRHYPPSPAAGRRR